MKSSSGWDVSQKCGNNESAAVFSGRAVYPATVDTIIQPLKPVTLGKLDHRINNNAA